MFNKFLCVNSFSNFAHSESIRASNCLFLSKPKDQSVEALVKTPLDNLCKVFCLDKGLPVELALIGAVPLLGLATVVFGTLEEVVAVLIEFHSWLGKLPGNGVTDGCLDMLN